VAGEIGAGQFLVLGRIGSLVPSPCDRSDFRFQSNAPERSPAHGWSWTPSSVDPRWIRRPVRFLIVSAHLVCGMCSSAPSLDAAATGGWSFWRDESGCGGGLLCYMFMVISIGYCSTILVWSDLPRWCCWIGLVSESWLWTVFGYSSSLLSLLSSFALISVNSYLGTVGGSPEIEFVRIRPVTVGLGSFCSAFG